MPADRSRAPDRRLCAVVEDSRRAAAPPAARCRRFGSCRARLSRATSASAVRSAATPSMAKPVEVDRQAQCRVEAGKIRQRRHRRLPAAEKCGEEEHCGHRASHHRKARLPWRLRPVIALDLVRPGLSMPWEKVTSGRLWASRRTGVAEFRGLHARRCGTLGSPGCGGPCLATFAADDNWCVGERG